MNSKGFSTIEALLSSTILILIVTAFMGAFIYGSESTALAGQRARATFLAEEGLEASRNIRDAAFANLTDGTHGLVGSGNQWILSGTSDTKDIFTRNVDISDLGTNRKQVVATVNWTQNLQRSGSVILTTELSNWAKKIGNWANPTQEASIDLPGIQNGNKIQVQGNYAYIVRNGGVPEFVIIDITNPAGPSVIGSLTLSGAPKNIAVSGNYAYVASNYSSQELQIIDVSNQASPFLAGSYDAPGTSDMVGIYLVGTTVYLGRVASAQKEFSIVNVSNPASPSLIGSLELGTGSGANEIYVSGNYAYIASDKDSAELQVVDISTPSSPALATSLDLSGAQDGSTITGFGNTVIVGRLGSGGVAMIDVSTPTAPSLISTFSEAGAVRDLSLGNSNNYLFIASDINSAEFQVVNISSLVSPTLLGSLNMPQDLNGVAYSDDKDRAFVVSDYNLGEFAVIKPN